jgi:hypothetical protein
MRYSNIFTLLALGLAVGCTGKFARQEDAAERRIEIAEKAGASERSIEIAEDTLEQAEDAVERAEADREEARDELEVARKWSADTRRQYDRDRSEREHILSDLKAADRQLEAARARQTALGYQGLSTTEAESAAGPDIARAKQRSDGLRMSATTLERQMELSKLETEAADAKVKAADAQLRSAEQRLKVAGALYDQAAQQARAAEVEALSNRREEIDMRLRDHRYGGGSEGF